MHELSLIRALIRQVDDIRRQANADRVLRVRLSVGEFAGAVPELLASAFEQAVAETDMAGASLEWNSVPLEARCQDCGRDFVVERFHFSCPACGHNNVTILRGEHVLLESVTVNVAEEVGR